MKRQSTVCLIIALILTASFFISACRTSILEPARDLEKPIPSRPQENISAPEPASPSGNPPATPIAASKSLSWYYTPSKDHKSPTIPRESAQLLQAYQGIWLLPNSDRRIYLTFDEGYELGYTAQILDTLKANQVKAIFFITGQYVKTHPELVQRMKAEGHLVGNHTMNHKDLSKISQEEITAEISLLEKEVLSRTGLSLDPYLRPPMGTYSDLSLALTREAGYTSVFWSMAYEDWDPNKQPGEDKAFQFVIRNVHPGAVILLHAVSQSNAQALDRIIKELKSQGYNFALFS